MLISSFSFSSSRKNVTQAEAVTFCETYTQQEFFTQLDQDDRLFTWILREETDPESSKIGTCAESDFKALWNYIHSDSFKNKVPKDLIIAAGLEVQGQKIPLHAIHKNNPDKAFPLKQDLAEVSIRKDGSGENYALFIKFSKAGTEKWASLTRLNKGRDIAILYNGSVLAAPRLQEEIKNGECMISGKFTESEIKQLKSVFEK